MQEKKKIPTEQGTNIKQTGTFGEIKLIFTGNDVITPTQTGPAEPLPTTKDLLQNLRRS